MGTHFLGFPKVFFYKKSKVLFTYLFLYIENFPKSAKMGTHFFKTPFDFKRGGDTKPFFDFKEGFP